MSSAEMDHRAVRLALGLTVAGALMLTAGVATWLVTAVGRVASGPGPRDLRLAALVLLAGGAACGVAMGVALAAAGRARVGEPPVADVAGLSYEPAESPGPAPSLAEAWSLMNPPPPSPPPLAPSRPAPPPWSGGQWIADQRSREQPSAEQPSAEQPFAEQPSGEQSFAEQSFREQPSGEQPPAGPAPAGRVWWRAGRGPASWDDTSEEWLRSLRGPSIQQPPPHSAE